MKKSIKVSILVDNPSSWFHKYLNRVFEVVKKYDPHFNFASSARHLKRGDVLFILSCNRLLRKEQLSMHKNNIVIHESDLPKGRGWSPLTWQVERGKNKIPITMFEAKDGFDNGDYYIKEYIQLDGTELIDKIREKEVEKTIEMIEKYLFSYPMKSIPQRGKATYYRRRKSEDNELSINKSLKIQFNKMRVADNERYPLHFSFKRRKYILKIYKAKE